MDRPSTQHMQSGTLNFRGRSIPVLSSLFVIGRLVFKFPAFRLSILSSSFLFFSPPNLPFLRAPSNESKQKQHSMLIYTCTEKKKEESGTKLTVNCYISSHISVGEVFNCSSTAPQPPEAIFSARLAPHLHTTHSPSSPDPLNGSRPPE